MHIRVKVFAGAPKEVIQEIGEGQYRVFVREPAQAGWANRRVGQVLAAELGVSLHQVRLVSGGQRPNKVFEIIPDKEE
jgi:uncharacterized protein YggU (UPF0235/DUF167 family)